MMNAPWAETAVPLMVALRSAGLEVPLAPELPLPVPLGMVVPGKAAVRIFCAVSARRFDSVWLS